MVTGFRVFGTDFAGLVMLVAAFGEGLCGEGGRLVEVFWGLDSRVVIHLQRASVHQGVEVEKGRAFWAGCVI